MGVHFVPDAYTYATFEKRWDSDGKVFHNVIAHGDLTAKTPYGIIADEYGPVSEALPASDKYIYVGVPTEAVASGANCWLQIGGYITAVISTSLTVALGDGFTINSGAVADIAAAYSGAAGEFAVNAGIVTVSTTHAMILVPEQIITI